MRPFTRPFALAPDCHAAENRYADVWQRHFYAGLGSATPGTIFPREVDFTWARPAADTPNGPSLERSGQSQKLWEEIRASGCDAVVSYCFSSDIDAALVRDTVATGVPWVNFFCDGVYAFDRVAPLARETSLNWFPESAAEPQYRALGRPVLCRPYALNPAALPELVCRDPVHPLGFVGAAYGTRAVQLAILAALGSRVAVRGAGWRSRARRSAGHVLFRRSKRRSPLSRLKRVGNRLLVRAVSAWLRPGEALMDNDFGQFVSECRVILGLNEAPAGRRHDRSYLKLRDVEFPGYGACYLTQHNQDIARAFEVGQEVLTFRSLVEAAALAREYGARPAVAEAIGRAGRLRVLREHTWSTRLGEIVRAL